MNLVDSSGWLEYFADETNADFFAPAILEERQSEYIINPSVYSLLLSADFPEHDNTVDINESPEEANNAQNTHE